MKMKLDQYVNKFSIMLLCRIVYHSAVVTVLNIDIGHLFYVTVTGYCIVIGAASAVMRINDKFDGSKCIVTHIVRVALSTTLVFDLHCEGIADLIIQTNKT